MNGTTKLRPIFTPVVVVASPEAMMSPSLIAVRTSPTTSAILNVRRHARASVVCVRAWEADGMLLCEITDDGDGFDVEAVGERPEAALHLGLAAMGERIRLKRDFDISRFTPAAQAILKGLKQYGMFVADNGLDWAISIAPDPRIPVLHEEHGLSDHIDQLFNSSEKRLARTLLLLAHYGARGHPQKVLPKVAQEMLSEMSGTTRPRVNFFMNKFRKLGFIQYNKGEIHIDNSLLSVVLHD